jgi:4-hydroxybenzoate polyprenyltransferase
MATDERTNLKGSNKRRALVAAFGENGFDYAGDSRADLAVWRHASSAWLVGRDASLARRAAAVSRVAEVIEVPRAGWRDWLKALRLHQWIKNLLIFVPLLGSHQLGDPELLLVAVAAFVAFGCVASANYLLNDLLDIPHDRHHANKRRRALAAGLVTIPAAVSVMVVLFAAGFTIASLLPTLFVGALGLYMLGALAYSFGLKRRAPMDIFTLAGLYTLRVLAGNAATGIPLSFWLLSFSIFLFLSLAMVKRHAELATIGAKGDGVAHGRGYLAADREMVGQLGVAAGYIAVLILALYLNSPEASAHYARPQLLWLLCLLFLHWITRIWLVAHRGWLHDDPVVFAIQDRRSQMTALAALLLLYLAQ